MDSLMARASNFLLEHPIISIIGVISTGVGILRVYCRLTLGMCHCQVDMTGKTVLITGATAGIGKETALDLAKRGARVLLGCRNQAKAEKTVQEIILATGNPEVFFKPLDLSSFKSVRECAQEILLTEGRLDVLINNAGIVSPPGDRYQMTEDGCEIVMQSNHLGHFLLTILSSDLLKMSAPSRIVIVASSAYAFQDLDIDRLAQVRKMPHHFYLYGNSKLANVLFMKELAERLKGTGVTVNALDPGAVLTDILLGQVGWALKFAYLGHCLVGKSAREGAQTSICLSVNPSLLTTTGKYFADCRERALDTRLVTPERAKELFEKSEEVIGLFAKVSDIVCFKKKESEGAV